MIGKKVIVRTYSAGVHYGTLKSRKGKECVLLNSRRLYYWKGANSLSQLAMEGVRSPLECKFSVPVKEIVLTEGIEFIPVSKVGVKVIDGVPEWKQ